MLGADNYILAAGFLQKPRGGMEAIVQGGWVERYFILTKKALLYYHITAGMEESSGTTLFGPDGELLLYDEKKMFSIHNIVEVRWSSEEDMHLLGQDRSDAHHAHFTVSTESSMTGALTNICFRSTSHQACRMWIRALRHQLSLLIGPGGNDGNGRPPSRSGSVDISANSIEKPRRSSKSSSSPSKSENPEMEQMRARMLALEQHIFSMGQGTVATAVATSGAKSLGAVSIDEHEADDDEILDEEGEADESCNSMAISGHLQKRARASARWQERWVEVEGVNFRYYHSGRHTPALSLELNSTYSVHALDGDDYAFTLTNGKKNLVFRVMQRRSAGVEYRDRWMRVRVFICCVAINAIAHSISFI